MKSYNPLPIKIIDALTHDLEIEVMGRGIIRSCFMPQLIVFSKIESDFSSFICDDFVYLSQRPFFKELNDCEIICKGIFLPISIRTADGTLLLTDIKKFKINSWTLCKN